MNSPELPEDLNKLPLGGGDSGEDEPANEQELNPSSQVIKYFAYIVCSNCKLPRLEILGSSGGVYLICLCNQCRALTYLRVVYVQENNSIQKESPKLMDHVN